MLLCMPAQVCVCHGDQRTGARPVFCPQPLCPSTLSCYDRHHRAGGLSGDRVCQVPQQPQFVAAPAVTGRSRDARVD